MLLNKSSKTSPALSAIALLGFLYFLNLIQNVLQGNSNGRKKRDVDNYTGGAQKVDDYLLSFEGIAKKLSESIPYGEDNKAEGRGLTDILNFFTGSSRGTKESEDRTTQMFSFLGSVFSKIPRALGFSERASSRNDENLIPHSEPSSEGFWSMFGNKIGLVAKIMDFLNDPRPSRVARSSQMEEEKIEIDPDEDYAEPYELSDEEKQFLPSYARNFPNNRVKRYAEDEMNIWYSEAESPHHSYEENTSGKLLGMVFNLFKQALTS